MSEKQELLEKLRIAKDAKALSYQDIADITEQNGEAVSLSTIKRMFQRDADLEDFRYHQTVRPVVRAVLGMDEETEKPAAKPTAEQAEQYYATIEGLKAVVDLKHEQIVALQKENERLHNDLVDTRMGHKDQIAKIEADFQKKIDYLKEIVVDDKSDKKWYRRVIIVLGIIAALAFAVLVLDLSLGNYGWIRY